MSSRERTEPGAGGDKAPTREKTLLGVSDKPAVPASPIVSVAPVRERTVLGVGASAPTPVAPLARERSVQEPPPEGWDLPEPQEPLRAVEAPAAAEPPKAPVRPAPEASIALDLVHKKAEPQPAPLPAQALSEASLAAAGVPRRRGRGWLVVLLLLAMAGSALWVMRHRVPWYRLRSLIGMTTSSPSVQAS